MSIPLPAPALCIRMRQVQRWEDKKCQLLSEESRGLRKIIINYSGLKEIIYFGIENAINNCKV